MNIPLPILTMPCLVLLTLFLLGPAPAMAVTKKTVRVGVFFNEPKIMPAEDGQPTGLLGDLLQAIAEREGWQLEPVQCEWQDCLALLEEGKIDLMPDVGISPARVQRFAFHQTPALHSWSQLFSRSGSHIHTPLELDRKRVAIMAGSLQNAYLEQLMDGFGIRLQILPVDSLNEAFLELQQGNVDLAASDHLYGNYHAARYGLVPTSIIFQPTRLYYAAPLGQGTALHARIDEWLQRWQAEPGSPYYTLLQRWGGEEPQTVVSPLLAGGLAVIAALLVLALVFVWLLRRQVRARTRALEASEVHLGDLMANIQAFIYHKDLNYRYQHVNEALCSFLGVEPEQLLGKEDADILDAETARSIRQVDQQVIEQGKRVLREDVITLPGSDQPHTMITVKMPLRDADGKIRGLYGISTDITEQRQQLEQLHQLSHFDPLTGLANRQQFQKCLTLALTEAHRSGQEGAVLFVDLDNFRDFNDVYGHEVGDQLLQAVATRLGQLSSGRAVKARFGGDEFVLLLEGLGESKEQALLQIETQAKAILRTLSKPFVLVNDQSYTGTASVGIAMFSDSPDEMLSLIKKAELAMYAAKGAGRSRFSFFDPSMQAQVRHRAELEAGIRRALEESEFRLWYQPQFNCAYQLIGLEALIRWQHPDQGIISPAEFIPVAEASGLILPLGRWILRTACEQLVAWQHHPVLAGVRIAVNISAHQIQHEHFVTEVFSILNQTGADPSHLELELTESLLVEDVEQTIEKMQQLRQRGIHFALDDFGTGYSSMCYLKRLPLDKLKIDQSFVQDVMTDSNDVAIIRTIVALGQSLDLAVIAEGVETSEQKQSLSALGCRTFQGYLFSRPVPAKELEQHIYGEN